MSKLKYFLGLSLLISLIAQAAPITVFGPKKFAATLSGATYNSTFNHSQNQAQGVITLINGDGSDLSPKNCKNLSGLQLLLCKAENIARELAVIALRPSSIEITLNGQVIATSNQFPGHMGKFQKAVTVKSSNTLKVKVKGSPLAFIKTDVKAESQNVNQLPIADFSATPSMGFAPIIISFSGLSSRDPDGTIVTYAWDFGDGGVSLGAIANHLYEAPGSYTVKLTVTDNQGASNTKSQVMVIQADSTPPQLSISSPVPNSTLQNQSIQVQGEANERLSNVTAQLDGETLFSLNLSADRMGFSGLLSTNTAGQRSVRIVARDLAGNETVSTIPFTYNILLPPLAKLQLKSPSLGHAPCMVLLDGTQSSDPAASSLTYHWDFGDGEEVIETSGLVTHTFNRAGQFTVTLRVVNAGGLDDEATVSVTVNEIELPADPGTLATPLVQNNVQVPFEESVSFLYNGPNAVQKNVQPGTIDASRVSVVRGKVVDEQGNGIPGTKVTVVKGSGLGYTLTRADGQFDIAVNGGSNTTVQFEKTGYLPAQRTVRLNYNDFSTTETAILVKTDHVVTKITNESSVPQVAKGSTISDQDGRRTAAIVIPAQTKALVELPNGQTIELPSLSLRITEYTVGENGPDKMPASLPKSTSYTYAVDITADEALALNAKHIRFSKPVSFYVDNFLNFPTGSVIPVGSYDYDKGMWLPEANGRVIKVLSEQNNKAIIDVLGSGSAATNQQLADLGIDDSELMQIADLYDSGITFWRATATRFSPMDLNILGAASGLPPSNAVDPNDPNFPPGGQCLPGSYIDVLSQSLGESIPLIGTDFHLNYQSKSASDNTILVRLTQGQPPAELQRIDLTIEVAGNIYKRSFSPSRNLLYTYNWNGLDVYGRKTEGRVKAKVKVSYLYPMTYLTPSLDYPSEFGMFSVNLVITNVAGRELGVLSTDYNTFLGKPYLNHLTIGGWTIPNYHSYNHADRILYRGDGRMIGGIDPSFSSGRPFEVVIGGERGFSPDGTIAKEAKLMAPHPILYASDRSIYFSDGPPLIRRVRPDGILETVAGTGSYGYTGDGGPASQATFGNGLNSIQLVEGEEKEFYVADIGNCVIRKIDKNGIISTIAGNGTCGFSGDHGPALQAQLGVMFHLAYHEGSLFTIESGSYRIREITAGGLIRTVVGTGTAGFSPDGTPATQAQINYPTGIAFTPSGELIFSEIENHRIRKIDKFGNLQTILGGAMGGNSPDGTPASEALITFPIDVKARADGSVFYRDGAREQIRYLSASGTLQTLAGIGGNGLSPSGELILQSKLGGIRQFDFSPEGDIYIVEQDNHRIIKVTDPINAKPDENGMFKIPSEDGTEIYTFNENGIHLRTLNGITGTTKYLFVHDSQNQLAEIQDGDGNSTLLSRNADGRVESIVGPYGHTTTLHYQGDYLSSLIMPNNNSFNMSYYPQGLLATFTKPNGAQSTFQYDSLGRLTKDTNAAGGFTSLHRGNYDTYFAVSNQSAEGITNSSSLTQNQNSLAVYNYSSTGKTTLTQSSTDGARTDVERNGQSSVLQSKQPNRRLGLPAKFTYFVGDRQGSTLRTDSKNYIYDRFNGVTDYRATERNYVNDIFNFSTVYDSQDKSYVRTSGENRTSKRTIDSQERTTLIQVGNLEPINFVYDSRGRLESQSQGNRTTQFIYGSNGRISSMIDPLGRQTSFVYDENLRKIKEILPGGREILYAYDANDNIISISPPNRPAHISDFNLVDLVSFYLPPNLGGTNAATTYTYNLDKKVTGIQKPGHQPITFQYSPTTGLLNQMHTSDGTYTYQYNLNGDLSLITSPDAHFATYEYTGRFMTGQDFYLNNQFMGRVSRTINNLHKTNSLTIQTADGTQTIGFLYDKDELPTTIGSESISYNTNALISQIQVGGVTTSFTYNSFGEPLQVTNSFGSTPLLNQTFNQDELGRIRFKTDGNDTLAYTYDSGGRLETVKKNNVEVARYSYDQNGNRTQAIINGQSFNATYDNQDRLLTYGTKTYSYTDAGDLASIHDSGDNSIRTFTYDSMGNLKQASVPGKNIQYFTSGDDARVRKNVNGVFAQGFIYQSKLQIAAEVNAQGVAISRFIYATKAHSPDYMIKAGVNYRILHDQLGSVRKVVNAASGQVVQEMTYDEFGKVLSDTNPGFQPFGFAGGLYDRDTGLVRFGARDYDPEVGRWTSKDPILFGGGQANLYSYTFNDPVNFIDPSGKFGIAGVASGFISGMVGGYISGGTIPAALAGGAAGAVVGFLNPFASSAAGAFAGGVASSLVGQVFGNVLTDQPYMNLNLGAAVFSGFGSAVGVQAAGAMACGRTGAAVVEGGASGLAEIFGGTLDQTRNYSPLFSPMIR